MVPLRSIHRMVAAIETLTGLDIVVNPDKKTMRTTKEGKPQVGCVYDSNTELSKELFRILVEDAKKQLALFRVLEAVEKGQPWRELFLIALDEAGWDAQELAEIVGVPSARNVRVVGTNLDGHDI